MAAKHYLNYNPEASAAEGEATKRQYSSSSPGGMGNSNNTTLSKMFISEQSHLKVSQNVIKDQFSSGQSILINTAGQNENPDFPNGHVTFNFAGSFKGNNIRQGIAQSGDGINPPDLDLSFGAPNPDLGNTTKKYHPDLSFPSKVDLSNPDLPPAEGEVAGIVSNPDKGYGSNNSQLGKNPGLTDAHIREDGAPGEQKIGKLYDVDEVMHP